MQTIKKILSAQEITVLPNFSSKLEKILTNDEARVIALKYKSKQFKDMDALEFFKVTSLLLLKISIITGWFIPEAEMKNLLIDQISSHLIERYGNLNSDEVEYAFRNRDLSVKDWGKNFNLTLMDEVLIPYLGQRFELSRIEENSTAPEQKIYTDEEILNQRRGEIETAYQAIRSGHYPIIHAYFFDVLIHDRLLNEHSEPELEGEVEVESVEEFFVRKINSQAENIYKHD